MNTIQQSNIKNPGKKDLIRYVESNYLKKKKKSDNQLDFLTLKVGDIIRIGYLIPEGEKERTQYYQGLIIAIKNRGIGKSLIIRRTVQGIGIEQIFILNSPKIVSILKKQSSKVRRSKLYFIRKLRGKSTRLKIKID
uniref:50S ribosomal protein L19, chloroplastic n=1 Tax=Synura sphagnicola TaxID=52556 RepID=A0A3G2QYM1_9STRA|nr:ribosomal protein L19 [Synura sphagnicola]